jgi:peroxiredoxin
MKIRGELLKTLPELVVDGALCMLLLWLSAITGYPAEPRFLLRDTAGTIHSMEEWKGSKAVVLFFVATDCQVGNSYVPEMNRIQATYAARGARFYAVVADTTVSPAAAAEYAREYRYTFPLLLDPLHLLVQMTDASVTPQAVVLSPQGKVLYRGRIDNRVEDFGSTRPEATVHDLRDALAAVLAGKPVAAPFTKSIGCAIPRAK